MPTPIEELVRDLLKRGIPVGTGRDQQGKLVAMWDSLRPFPTAEERQMLMDNVEEVRRIIDALTRTP